MVAKTVSVLTLGMEIPQKEENIQQKHTRQHSVFSAKTKTEGPICAKASSLVLNKKFFQKLVPTTKKTLEDYKIQTVIYLKDDSLSETSCQTEQSSPELAKTCLRKPSK